MYLLKCLFIKFIFLTFFINCFVCEEDENLVTQKLQKLKKQVERFPRNCFEAAAGTFKSGIYDIQINRINDSSIFEVWCEEETDFGGWIVIQRRVSADEDFHRGWNDYKHGFGNLSANFWLGLDELHALTTSCEQELYIKMELFNGTKYYAKYDLFVVGSEAEDYVLKTVGKYSGTAGDFLKYDEGMKFSTHDRDNNNNNPINIINCAEIRCGGWWYDSCYWGIYSNLNGNYTKAGTDVGITWIDIEPFESLKFVEMMIRPTDNCKKRLAMKY